MNNRPTFIGTSQGIVNLSQISSIRPMLKTYLAEKGENFGIFIATNSSEGSIHLYGQEAEFFVQKIGLIDWIPGKSHWAYPSDQGGSNG